MNISRLFVLRPVATSLLMVALVLVGLVAVRIPAGLLAPGCRLSDHPGADLLPRRQPSGDGDHRHRAARGAARRDSEPHPDDVRELRRGIGHHPAVQSGAQSGHRRAKRPASHQRGQQLAADGLARTAGVREGESRRSADPDARGHLRLDVPDAAAGHRQQPARLEDLRGAGGRARDPLGRQRAGGPGRSGPAEAGGLRPQHRRHPYAPRQHQREPAQGQLRRSGARLHHQRQRSDTGSERLSEHGDRLSERCSGVHARRRAGDPGRPGYRAGRLDQSRPRHRAQRDASAGGERHRHGQPDQGAASAAAGDAASGHARRDRRRQHRRDPRLGVRRGIRAHCSRLRSWFW